MRVRLIDGLNCTPMVFGEKLRSRKLTVPVLETVGEHDVRLSAEFALVYTEQRQASQARNAHTQLMDLVWCLKSKHQIIELAARATDARMVSALLRHTKGLGSWL